MTKNNSTCFGNELKIGKVLNKKRVPIYIAKFGPIIIDGIKYNIIKHGFDNMGSETFISIEMTYEGKVGWAENAWYHIKKIFHD